MPQKTVVLVAAWLEIIVGISLVIVPGIPCRLLFGAAAEGVATPIARFAGIALVALGVACLPSKAAGLHRSAVLGLLIFNAGATIFLVWVGVATTFHGIALWPGVVLHAVIAAALMLRFPSGSALPS